MRQHAWVVKIALLVLLLGPCDETLPPYTEPDVFFTGKISAYYDLTPTTNGVTVYITATNNYEETLDDIAEFRGSVEIMATRNPEVKKTITLNSSNLVYARNYNRSTGRFIIDPKDSVMFSASWNFASDDRKVDLRKDFFVYYDGQDCGDPPLRCLAGREEFVITGQLFIFSARSPIHKSMLLPVCYVSNWVRLTLCARISTYPPCSGEPSYFAPRCSPTSGGDQQ